MNSASEVYDAVIQGAGPAGSTAARLLARSGWKVLLMDRVIPGSPKVCGGFLGPEVMPLVESLDLGAEWKTFKKAPLQNLMISGPGSGRFYSAQLPGGRAHGVDRGLFDRWLFESALESGAHSRVGAEGVRARRLGGIWEIDVQDSRGGARYYARHFIRASGRRPAKVLSRQSAYFACKSVYQNMGELDERVALHFVPGGHIGVNDLGDGRALMCLYADGKYLREFRTDLDGMMSFFGRLNPCLGERMSRAVRIEGWQTCQAEPDGKFIFNEGGAFHVGDQVAMINPIIGGGMAVAMKSSQILSTLLLSLSVHAPTEGVTRLYRREWFKRTGWAARWAGIMGYCERQPLLSNGFWKILNGYPGALDALFYLSRRHTDLNPTPLAL